MQPRISQNKGRPFGSSLLRLLIINGAIMLIYSIIFFVTGSPSSGGLESLGWAIGMMVAVALHTFVLLILALISLFRKTNRASIYFLGALIIAMVGFGVCLSPSIGGIF